MMRVRPGTVAIAVIVVIVAEAITVASVGKQVSKEADARTVCLDPPADSPSNQDNKCSFDLT